MSKMIEAQEAFQVGLGMAEMRDAENMLNMYICYTVLS